MMSQGANSVGRANRVFHPAMVKSASWLPEAESSGKDMRHLMPFLESFADELEKIALAGAPATVSSIKSTIPRNTMKMSTPRYSKVNPGSVGSPTPQYQPVLSPPPVRG